MMQAHKESPIRFLAKHSYTIGAITWVSVDAILEHGHLHDGTDDAAVGDEILASASLYPMEVLEGRHGERYVRLRDD